MIFSVSGSLKAHPNFCVSLGNFKPPPIFPGNFKAQPELPVILSAAFLPA